MTDPKSTPRPHIPNFSGAQSEGYFGSQAWEATSPGEQAAERGPTAAAPPDKAPSAEAAANARDAAAPDAVDADPAAPPRAGAAASDPKDSAPAVPGGRNPDSAMCEDRAHPGQIDKDNDC